MALVFIYIVNFWSKELKKGHEFFLLLCKNMYYYQISRIGIMYIYYIIKWVYIFNLNLSIQGTNFLYTLFLQTNYFYVITHNVSKL